MSRGKEPPRLYFRIREPGASVFRVATESPQRRLELDLIAIANLRTGEIKSQGEGPTSEERAEISDWIAARRKSRPSRDLFEMQALVEKLNQSAQWLQTRAAKKAVLDNAEALLFALHDLRSVVVRRMAETDEKMESEE